MKVFQLKLVCRRYRISKFFFLDGVKSITVLKIILDEISKLLFLNYMKNLELIKVILDMHALYLEL